MRQDQPGPRSASPSAATAPTFAGPAGFSEWTADKLTQAFTAIDAKIGAHPADYIRVTIGSNNVVVQAINPNKREIVDQYTYQGAGVQVAPVDTSGSEPGAVEMSKFKSDTVNPAVLVQVIKSAVKDSGVENGDIITVVYEKFFADQPEPKIQVTVKGPRGAKSLQYDVTGHLLSAS